MAGTFEALGVVVVAILPGGAYVWALERRLGPWGAGATDRILRLIGTSAAFHVVAAPLSYWLWAELVRPGRVARGEPLSWLFWLVPVAYVGMPWLFGTLVGSAAQSGRLPRVFDRVLFVRSPRAWDVLWADPNRRGWVRLRLKSGVWIWGGFGAHFPGGPSSYASRFPEPGDLWLAPVLGPDGKPRGEGAPSGVLVRWEEVEYLEFVPR